MDSLLAVLRCAVPTLYVITTAFYGMVFFGQRGPLVRIARPLFLLTLLVHGIYLATFVAHHQRIPLAAGAEILTVIAFMTALAYGYVEARTRTLSTGFFLLGFSTVLQFASSGRIALELEVAPLLRIPAFGVHTGAAILGYASFAVSAIYGLLFLLLYAELKSSRFGLLYRRLPPLEILAKMNIRAAVLGLASLTLAIVAGVVWANRLHPGYTRDPMFLLTILVWVIYSSSIFAHYRLGWRGRRAILLSICGFLIMGIALVGATVFLHGFHRFA